MDECTITVISAEPDTAPPPENAEILRFLREYNQEFLTGWDFRPLTVVVRDESGRVLGGCSGRTYGGWLQVDYLAVSPELRGQGYGARVLAAAEAEALRRGCHSAHLDTFSFQARPFYEKQGYRVFGTLTEFPQDQECYFMMKKLTGAASA